ncbi:hypothetical protein [Phormidium sp. FACHB-1136]|jgi:hypothetical protein|uniref:hypothetical protein n=1 Tax=Phormidium sp. FACHB-1136 TaxID=2692848 RepID=UPI0016869A98|nr:hypothetical protein [Phormidium sp. FACHB-1136]MBD2426794.1 hypothetical protein [Phormidium sp. FACHB-1136]
MVMVRETPVSSRNRVQGYASSRVQGDSSKRLGGNDARQQELSDFQHLIEHLTADGRLARRDEEAILSALVAGEGFSTAKCALFRQLQERVWRAELYLDS